MSLVVLVPAVIWLAAFATLAAVLHAAARKRAREGGNSKRLAWLSGAALAMGGAAAPTAIALIATDGAVAWAGVPLALVSAVLVFMAFRGERVAKPAVMTFREKSAAVSVATILIVYGWATWSVMQLPSELPDLAGAFGFLIATSVMMALLMALSHVVLAIMREPEKEDERDKLVGWRSTRNGYVVMAIGAWGVLALVFAQASPGMLAYALLGLFVLAELVRFSSELIYYRLDV
jgi:hypothetical protein